VNKAWWLDLAEIIDSLRVFPRLLLASAFGFVAWYAYYALNTVVGIVQGLPAMADATTPELIAQNIVAGVVGITVPLVGNIFAKVADIYMQTGRKWEGNNEH